MTKKIARLTLKYQKKDRLDPILSSADTAFEYCTDPYSPYCYDLKLITPAKYKMSTEKDKKVS